MSSDLEPSVHEDAGAALAQLLVGPNYARYVRFVVAIFGVMPWIGGFVAASAALHAEREQGEVNVLVQRWLEAHQRSYDTLQETVLRLVKRIEELGPTAQERLDDEKFLGLVTKAFRIWDESSTEEKREYVRRTVLNAAATRLCSDDLVRIFLQWVSQYDELHFRAIRALYRSPGSTRSDIWQHIHGQFVREDSAEADLFKLIIRDLSTGGVLRQRRETTNDGRFVAKRPVRTKQPRSTVLSSAFDDDKPYELTELGRQFVSYVLDEPTARLTASTHG